MTRHLAKVLDMIWYLSMGLFLGLTAGLVLAVILTFRGARAIDATPGVEPFSDPRFAAYHNDAVAGYIGQDLFMVGGTVAFILFGVATLARMGFWQVLQMYRGPVVGKKLCTSIQITCMAFSLVFLIQAAMITKDMNATWPRLYDQSASEDITFERRFIFDQQHKRSEGKMRLAWPFCFLALAISPWCRRIADAPVKEAEVAHK